MQQTNLESDKVAALIEEITAQTGESKIEAVTKALELRLQNLEAKSNTESTLMWLENSIWAKGKQDKIPTKADQEALLGF